MKREMLAAAWGYVLFSTLFLSGCFQAGCIFDDWSVKGSGSVITETRDVSGFHSILSEGSWNIFLSQGGEERLSIETDDNLLPLISTTVRNGTLRIRSIRSIRPSSEIRVYVMMKEVKCIQLAGSGDIRGETPLCGDALSFLIAGSGDVDCTVHASSVRSVVAGSGDIRLSGKAEDCSFEINGSGEIRSFDLQTKRCSVRIDGSGDIQVHADDSLTAVINGSGDIYYKGKAEKIVETVNGSGTIRRM